MVERELDDALVALREPTGVNASAPLEPVLATAARRRRCTRFVQAAAVTLVVLLVGAGLVRLVGRGEVIETRAPGMTFGVDGPVAPEQVQQTADLVRARLVQLGQPDAEVVVEGGAVVVRRAGDGGQVALAAAPSVVSFRPVLDIRPPNPPGASATADPSRSGWLPDRTGGQWYEVGPSDVDGGIVQSAFAQGTGSDDFWTINATLRPGPDGIDRFNALNSVCRQGAEACPTRHIAVVVAGRVVGVVRQMIGARLPEEAVAFGPLTEASARELVGLLDLGNLPVTLNPR